jgi:hypothetical protein
MAWWEPFAVLGVMLGTLAAFWVVIRGAAWLIYRRGDQDGNDG